MKKLFSLFFALAASVGTMNAADIEHVKIGKFYYDLYAGSLTATLVPEASWNENNYADAGLTDVIIPDEVYYENKYYSVTALGQNAFMYCSSMTSVVIPNSVKRIEGSAFSYCTNLSTVTIGSGVTEIGNTVWWDCTSLTGVYITDLAAWCNIDYPTGAGTNLYNPLQMAHKLYLNGELVTDLVIPDGIKTIKHDAFLCAEITSVSMPSTVEVIGGGAFYSCKQLKSVNISENVKEIGGYAFYDCSVLEQIQLPNTLQSLGEHAFGNCKEITEITIPEALTFMGTLAFDATNLNLKTVHWNAINCNPNGTEFNNATTFTFGDKVEIIHYELCKYTKMTSLKIPNSVREIGGNAFYRNYYLEAINIGNHVDTIGSYAFQECGAIYISCAAPIPPRCGSYIFLYVNKSTPLYVPEASIDAYKAADQWKDFTDIRPLVDIFHVTFLSWDGAQLKAEYVESGKSATAPDAPEREGYIFKGWDNDFSAVAEDMIITAVYEKEHKPGDPEILDINLNAATEMAYTGCSATPSVDDDVLTVNYTSGGWQWAGVEFALDNITNVINISFDYKGDGANVVIYPYLRDSQGVRWTKSNLWLNLSATDWQSVTTYLPDALLWDAADYAFGDKPFAKLGFVANPGTTTEGAFYLRNLKIEYKTPTLDPTALDQITNDQLPTTHKVIHNGQILILRDDRTYTLTGQEVR